MPRMDRFFCRGRSGVKNFSAAEVPGGQPGGGGTNFRVTGQRPHRYRRDVARGGGKRSLDVRAHLWRIWRRLEGENHRFNYFFGKVNQPGDE